MLEIKLHENSHKLWGQTTARLLSVEVFTRSQLHDDFVEYDTAYHTSMMGDDNIELPKCTLLVLTFTGNKGIPFTVCQKYGYKKWESYKANIGQEYKIVTDLKPELNPLQGKLNLDNNQ